MTRWLFTEAQVAKKATAGRREGETRYAQSLSERCEAVECFLGEVWPQKSNVEHTTTEETARGNESYLEAQSFSTKDASLTALSK